jgi:hypothetical protein
VRRLVGSLTFRRQDRTTSSEIAVNLDAVQLTQLTIKFKLLALPKILRDDDSPEGGMRCVGIKIYPFPLSSKPLSWSPVG